MSIVAERHLDLASVQSAWQGLNKLVPLGPITGERDYKRRVRVMDELLARIGANESHRLCFCDFIGCRSVNKGAASQSYSLQVAALAGVPNDVIRAAKKQLFKLEQNSAAQNPQGDLFDRKPEMPEPEEHPVLKSLREMQPKELSPKEALERLYQLKKLV